MKQNFGKYFILIPIGLFFLAGSTIIAQFVNVSDNGKGILFGIGVGLILLPFILKKFKSKGK